MMNKIKCVVTILILMLAFMGLTACDSKCMIAGCDSERMNNSNWCSMHTTFKRLGYD